MFLDRRSLLQSAASLLLPSTAATAVMASTVNPELERAVEGYLEAFRAYYGQPYRPDDNTVEAHKRADEDRKQRSKAFDHARHELTRLVMARYGLDREDESVKLSALSVDVGDITVVVAADVESGNDDDPYGREIPALLPRTAAARARLDAIKAFNPWAFESEEEEERLEIQYEPPLGFDPARMPADEPVPVRVTRTDYGKGENRYTHITRTWTPEGAMACQRCKMCEFGGMTEEEIGKDPSCDVNVWPDDAELVLYGPTPPEKDGPYPNGLMVDTAWDWPERDVIGTKPARLEVLVMSRAAWEADPRSKDDEWVIAKGPRGTRGNLVAVARKLTGPQPWILEQVQVAAESTV